MDAFVAQELFAGLDPGGHDFAEFFRSSTLSLTVARWPAGSVDDQEPHIEDEVYYVVSGRARLRVAEEDAAVGAAQAHQRAAMMRIQGTPPPGAARRTVRVRHRQGRDVHPGVSYRDQPERTHPCARNGERGILARVQRDSVLPR